jgi:hypothetical protein
LSECIAEVAELVAGAGLAVFGGVDLAEGPRKSHRPAKAEPDVEELVRAGRLPFFGFAVGRVTAPALGGPPWRQTSVKRDEAELVEEENVPGTGRVVTVAERRVGVLICGELYSHRARTQLGRERPDLFVDVGHVKMPRFIPAMRALARVGHAPVTLCHHLHSNLWGKRLPFINAAGENQSRIVTEDDLIQSDALWAAWGVQEV